MKQRLLGNSKDPWFSVNFEHVVCWKPFVSVAQDIQPDGPTKNLPLDISKGKFFVGPSGWISCATDTNGFQHTTCSKLTENHGSFEFPSNLCFIWFDTSNVMGFSRSDGVHKINQGRF